VKTVDDCTAFLAAEILSRVIIDGFDIRDREAPCQVAQRGFTPLVGSAPKINVPEGHERFYAFFEPNHLSPHVGLSLTLSVDGKRNNIIEATHLLCEHSKAQEEAAEDFIRAAAYRALEAYKLLSPAGPQPVLMTRAKSTVDFIDNAGNAVDNRKVLTSKTTITVFRVA